MTDPGRKGMLSEINVTPLVDVMLVLLIIFMISSSIETLQVQQEKERIKKVIPPEQIEQKVPVNLPRTDAEPVNLAQDRKLVLTINDNAEFYVGETLVLKCLDVAPALKPAFGAKRKSWGTPEDAAFGKCLEILEQKLSSNEKLKQDKEMYLRADQSVPYGLALKVMARIRKSGVGKFGLVADPEL
jgi:biopolymer transport protein TolR